MNPQSSPVALRQHCKIAASLRSFYNPERILLPRHGKIRGIVAGDLQKHARVRTAFVRLPGRMQKSRTEAQARRDAFLVANRVTYRLQTLLVLTIHRDERQGGEIISGLQP